MWEKIGGFDGQYPMKYEDVDMGLRLVLHNLFLNPLAKVIHLGNATLQYTQKDRWRFHQGRLRLLKKHYRGLDYAKRYCAVKTLDYIADQSAKVVSTSRRVSH